MEISVADEQPISVVPILPDNQNAGVTGYFNLLVNSGDKQTIYMQITNNKKENIVIALAPANAYTRPTGGIFYSEEIDSPETIIVGGVLISEIGPASEDIEVETEKDEAKFKVITKNVFAAAIQLDFPEQATPVFSFGNAGFNPVGPNVFIAMRNDAPMIQREVFGEYQVTDKDGQEVFSGLFEPISMAPKTQMNFPMHWDSSVLEPGEYTLSIAANVVGEEIVAVERFNIDKTTVETYAERTNQPKIRWLL